MNEINNKQFKKTIMETIGKQNRRTDDYMYLCYLACKDHFGYAQNVTNGQIRETYNIGNNREIEIFEAHEKPENPGLKIIVKYAPDPISVKTFKSKILYGKIIY